MLTFRWIHIISQHTSILNSIYNLSRFFFPYQVISHVFHPFLQVFLLPGFQNLTFLLVVHSFAYLLSFFFLVKIFIIFILRFFFLMWFRDLSCHFLNLIISDRSLWLFYYAIFSPLCFWLDEALPSDVIKIRQKSMK